MRPMLDREPDPKTIAMIRNCMQLQDNPSVLATYAVQRWSMLPLWWTVVNDITDLVLISLKDG